MSTTTLIAFNDVRVPVENLLGPENQGAAAVCGFCGYHWTLRTLYDPGCYGPTDPIYVMDGDGWWMVMATSHDRPKADVF